MQASQNLLLRRLLHNWRARQCRKVLLRNHLLGLVCESLYLARHDVLRGIGGRELGGPPRHLSRQKVLPRREQRKGITPILAVDLRPVRHAGVQTQLVLQPAMRIHRLQQLSAGPRRLLAQHRLRVFVRCGQGLVYDSQSSRRRVLSRVQEGLQHSFLGGFLTICQTHAACRVECDSLIDRQLHATASDRAHAGAHPLRAKRLGRRFPNPEPNRPVELFNHLGCHLVNIPRLVRRHPRSRLVHLSFPPCQASRTPGATSAPPLSRWVS
eukprot:57295-Pleurochrysis_carterae.AAC.2